jgi:hypothetical protein
MFAAPLQGTLADLPCGRHRLLSSTMPYNQSAGGLLGYCPISSILSIRNANTFINLEHVFPPLVIVVQRLYHHD